MRNTRISLLAASALMAAASMSVSSAAATSPGPLRNAFKAPRLPLEMRGKRYPQMVTSSEEAIALHNATVSTRQVLRHRARHA